MPPKAPATEEEKRAAAALREQEQKLADDLKAQRIAEEKGLANFELTNLEDIKVAEGLNAEAKAAFVAAVRDLLELNGTGDQPGVQASYIDVNQYVQSFDTLPVSVGMKKALFLAYNWNALGRGTGGLAGSAVRWTLREQYIPAREMTIHTKVPVGAAALIQDYDRAARAAKDLVNFFLTNAVSVAALAGAMINRIVHHWDSKHTGAQKAFINAMGMAEHLAEDQFRAVFYLAIHPLPLRTTEAYRKEAAAGRNNDVAEVVRLRCEGPPAGYGALNACAAAVPSILGEKIMNPHAWPDKALPPIPDENGDFDAYYRENAKIAAYNEKMTARRAAIPALVNKLVSVVEDNKLLIEHADEYHQFAIKYDKPARKILDTSVHEQAMIILTAYIFAKIKGSLANSAAVRKYRDQHAREVNKRVAAFAEMDEGETIFDLLGV